MKRQFEQPDLVNDWGVPFYGRAETVTGCFWWYQKDGKRYQLRPVHVSATDGERA